MDRKKEKDIEFKLYRLMCAGCENERHCHNACIYCEEFQEELERELENE